MDRKISIFLPLLPPSLPLYVNSSRESVTGRSVTQFRVNIVSSTTLTALTARAKKKYDFPEGNHNSLPAGSS